MFKKKIISILAISLFASVGFAQSALDDEKGSLILSFAGIANENVDQLDQQSDDTSYDLNYGLAVLVEAGINDHFGIETGVLYTKVQYDAEAAGARFVQSVNRLHVPVLARYWIVDYFSVGAGPYASFKTGSVQNTVSIGDVELGDVETSADDSVQFGLDFAATFNFAIADKTGIFLEGRYSLPFDEEPNEDVKQVYALAGLKIDL